MNKYDLWSIKVSVAITKEIFDTTISIKQKDIKGNQNSLHCLLPDLFSDGILNFFTTTSSVFIVRVVCHKFQCLF